MAIYVMSDLHGNYELFMEMLDKIHFNSATDFLYILGDVIDHNYGGLKIVDYIMTHKDCCELLLGNHESNFINEVPTGKIYDRIIEDSVFAEAVRVASNAFESSLVSKILPDIQKLLQRKKSIDAIRKDKVIAKWLKDGNTKLRENYFDVIVTVIELLKHSHEDFELIFRLYSLSRFNLIPTVRELLDCDRERYYAIKDFFQSCVWHKAIYVNERRFILSHMQADYNISMKIIFPHANMTNTTFVFGHEPVANLYKIITSLRDDRNYPYKFSFDYRKALAWADSDNNAYYHIDTGDYQVVAIRLDDMQQFYIQKATKKKPQNYFSFNKSADKYEKLSELYLGQYTFQNAAIASLRNGCYEFLIGIDWLDHTIVYSPIWLSTFLPVFTVNYDGNIQSIEEIIDTVRKDWNTQQTSDTVISHEEALHLGADLLNRPSERNHRIYELEILQNREAITEKQLDFCFFRC